MLETARRLDPNCEVLPLAESEVQSPEILAAGRRL
jgi:hypothetical protein